MYKKKLEQKSKANTLVRPVYIDGHRYSSLCAAAIDFEFSYHSFHTKITTSDGPITYSGHIAVLESWVLSHPEYSLKKEGEK